MAGYSGTPLASKLGIKAGHRVSLLKAPESVFVEITSGSEEAQFHKDLAPGSNVIVSFSTSSEEVSGTMGMLIESLVLDGGLWIAWPKKASKVPTDITEDKLRELFLPNTPMVDNKVCAIDEVWSGLRFVRRRIHR